MVGVAMAAAVIGAPTTHAESLTRYWSYWNGSDGVWAYATQGAGTAIPRDGDVEAWSFVVSEGMSASPGRPPRDPGQVWQDVCGTAEPREGQKAVAVVLDFGTADIAPAGETPPAPGTGCAVVDEDANGFQILSAVADVRADGGFLCGIDGYPREECAPILDAVEPKPTTVEATKVPSEESTGAPWWTLGVLIVAVLVGVLVWRRR
jgi:hypothetical protein